MSVAETWRHDTTTADLTVAENVKDARHELRRATTTDALAAWAGKWGEPAIAALALREDHDSEVEEAEEAANEAEAALAKAKEACDGAADKLEQVLDLIEEGNKDGASAAIVEVQNLLSEAA